jgi:hypothetical protein
LPVCAGTSFHGNGYGLHQKPQGCPWNYLLECTPFASIFYHLDPLLPPYPILLVQYPQLTTYRTIKHQPITTHPMPVELPTRMYTLCLNILSFGPITTPKSHPTPQSTTYHTIKHQPITTLHISKYPNLCTTSST